jgi:hypothetical protein
VVMLRVGSLVSVDEGLEVADEGARAVEELCEFLLAVKLSGVSFGGILGDAVLGKAWAYA